MLRRSSRSTVEGEWPNPFAISRIESPRSTPAKISSRSAKDKNDRCAGR
jgi:hypothetical protein